MLGPLLGAVGGGAQLWHWRMLPAMGLQAGRPLVVSDAGRVLVGNGSALIELSCGGGVFPG